MELRIENAECRIEKVHLANVFSILANRLPWYFIFCPRRGQKMKYINIGNTMLPQA
jgi:hypothetical protein